jgi:hypothetical protein
VEGLRGGIVRRVVVETVVLTVGAGVGEGVVGHGVDTNDDVMQYRKQGLWYAVPVSGSHTTLTTLASHRGHVGAIVVVMDGWLVLVSGSA